jgi:hypothetical protein
VAGAALVLLLAACGSSPPHSTVPSGGAIPSPAAGTSSATTLGSSAPSFVPPPASSPGESPSTSIVPSSSGAAAVDPSLLDLVPATAAGLTLTFDPDTTAMVAADPALAEDAAAVATGLAVPSGQATPAEFVIVNLVRLRDASRDEEWFRSWRDSYDEAACERAGGIVRHAETQSAGRTVFIGSCAQGVLTYHVRIGAGVVVLSMTSIGPGHLGQTLIDKLPT